MLRARCSLRGSPRARLTSRSPVRPVFLLVKVAAIEDLVAKLLGSWGPSLTGTPCIRFRLLSDALALLVALPPQSPYGHVFAGFLARNVAALDRLQCSVREMERS